jgi:hypothetical protein
LDRQIGWLFTLENATGVKSDLSGIALSGSVRN